MATFSDLLAQMQASDFVTSAKSFAKTIGLFPDDWVAFDPEDAIINSTGSTAATWWNTYVWSAINGGFLETAKKIWLTKLAKNVFNVDRITATFATGGWTGTNSTASPIGPFNPDDLLFYNLDTNQTYRNTDTVTFAPGVNTPITIEADALGSVGNAAPSRVKLLTTVLGMDGVNASPLAALDDETDPALVLRCRYKFAALSPNGPSDAYRYVALTPSLNGGVAINRVLIPPATGTGGVTVVLASASGVVSSPDVATVKSAIVSQVVPNGITPTVISATANTIDVNWQAWVHANQNVDPTAVTAAVNQALVLAFQSFPIGGDAITPGNGRVFVDRLVAIIAAAVPQAFQIVVTLPAGDVVIGAYEVPVLGSTSGAAGVTVVT